MKKRAQLVVLLLLVQCVLGLTHLVQGSSPGVGRGRAPQTQVPAEPQAPGSCSLIRGTAAVTVTRDQGKTLTPTEGTLNGIGYTFGLAVLDEPETLLAVHNTSLLRSADGGCSWAIIAELQPVGDYLPSTLTPAPGGRAYAWSDNRNFLARIDGTQVTYLKSPVENIHGLGTDRKDANHVRLGGDDGVWDSTDGGTTWAKIADLPLDGSQRLVYRFSFDPATLDHFLVGTAVSGAFTTINGGKTWQACQGFSPDNRNVNVFNLVVSPVKGSVVWAMGLNLTEGSNRNRHIYLSKDGGVTFQPVIDGSAEVTLVNGPLLVPHPKNANVLYFVFGTSFQAYGTDLFRYNAKSGKLTKNHNSYDGINSIAFAKNDPDIMYLGLETEKRREYNCVVNSEW
ncbi:MAG: dispase autolysis-inducing protein [Blastocatellia bacterium]|nr:dispase autolysis-inducing protein [Blastocatellia bacterium]